MTVSEVSDFDPKAVFGESFLGNRGRGFLVRSDYFDDFESVHYDPLMINRDIGQFFFVRENSKDSELEVYTALPVSGGYSVIPRSEEYYKENKLR